MKSEHNRIELVTRPGSSTDTFLRPSGTSGAGKTSSDTGSSTASAPGAATRQKWEPTCQPCFASNANQVRSKTHFFLLFITFFYFTIAATESVLFFTVPKEAPFDQLQILKPRHKKSFTFTKAKNA